MISNIVDSHYHLWRLADHNYDWLKSMPALVHDFTANDLVPLMRDAGVTQTIIVQALELEAETNTMLAFANEHDWITGIVGFTDLASDDAAAQVDWLQSHQRIVSLRNWPMLRSNPDWLAHSELDNGFAALSESRLAYDTLSHSGNLQALRQRMKRTPNLRVCINHFAYPDLNWPRGGDEEKNWITNLTALADLGCSIKLSGFARCIESSWQPAPYQRFVDHVFNIFDAKNIMWASNWPTVLTECSYSNWFNASKEWTEGLSTSEKEDVFRETAKRFYRLT